MTDKNNSDSGRISGKSANTGEPIGRIAGDSISTRAISEPETKDSKPLSSRQDRISDATQKKGLEFLPKNFGDTDGDWQIIESDNLFEVLYLDHHQIISIDPQVVKSNFIIIEKFWKEKKNLWESGSVQIRKAIEEKYGEKNLSNCTKKIEYAYDQLASVQKINDYYLKFSEQILKIGESKLDPLFKMMLKDGEAEPTEMENIFEEGLKLNLSNKEIASIITRVFDARGYKPYGNPVGNDLKEQLLSVSWMNEERFKVKKQEDEDRKKRGREIFENKFAYSIEEIGTILFNDEGQAKDYIKEGLVINSIDYFSSSKAKQVLEINKSKKGEHLKYLQIIYRLNPKLPFRFINKNYSNLKELSSALFDNPKVGKEYLTQGNIEIWLQESQPENYNKLIKIRDTAENIELAFLELLYTFNPDLPYRLAGSIMVKTPVELCSEIDKNKENWNAGREELFNSSILIWLRTIGKLNITERWDKIKALFAKQKDVGLENFLHILNENLLYPSLEISEKAFSFPSIQSGQNVDASFVLSNKTRGYIECNLGFSQTLDGVTLSSNKISLNPAAGIKSNKIKLSVVSINLLKGVDYKTDIQISTSDNKKYSIPVAFRLVFPRNAFIKELIKYFFLFALIGGIIRGVWTLFGFNDWLKGSYQYYLSSKDVYWQDKPEIFYFPLLFVILLLTIILLGKYWKKIISVMDKI